MQIKSPMLSLFATGARLIQVALVEFNNRLLLNVSLGEDAKVQPDAMCLC